MATGIDRLGLIKSSLLDFPGLVSAVIFTSGCNFHCPYCHNPDLAQGIIPETFVSKNEVIDLLRRRKNVLDGVVLTGGEPLLQQNLSDLVDEIRTAGLLIKIDTNGSFPDRLENIRPDYVAVDIKCSPEQYDVLTSTRDAVANLKSTINIIHEHEIAHEFRTTVVPGLVDIETFPGILDLAKGADRFVLNEFRPDQTLDPKLSGTTPYPRRVYKTLKQIAADSGVPCIIRGPSFT